MTFGDGDEEPSNVGEMQGNSEEALQWDESNSRRQEGPSTTSHTYGTLDDRHIWEAKDKDEA